MEQSVLNSTKKLLGLDASYTAFDTDVLTYINTALSRVRQLGYRPAIPGGVEDASVQWETLFPNEPMLDDIKSYVYLRVRLLFDPPDKPHHQQAMKEQREELEYELVTEGRISGWRPSSLPSLP